MNYYDDMKDAPLSGLLRQDIIKTDKQLIFSLIIVGKIFHELEEVQEHTLFFTKVVQLTMGRVHPKMSPTISFPGMYMKPFIYLSNRTHCQ